MIISTIRCYMNENSTGGVLLIDGEKFCETQEDTARAYGVKIPKLTAIPRGTYKVAIRRSHGFKRDMLVLYNHKVGKDMYIVRNEGIDFTFIYFHSGNTAEHSEGCIIIGHDRKDRDTVYNTAEKELFSTVNAALKVNEPVICEVINDPGNIYGYADSKYK